MIEDILPLDMTIAVGNRGQAIVSEFHRASNRIDEILWRLEGLQV